MSKINKRRIVAERMRRFAPKCSAYSGWRLFKGGAFSSKHGNAAKTYQDVVVYKRTENFSPSILCRT